MAMIDKEKEDVQNMKPGVLYYPVDFQFPVIDFVFVKETQTAQNKQVFCIQVTFGKKHDKPVSAYEELFDRLGSKETDKCRFTFFAANKMRRTMQN